MKRQMTAFVTATALALSGMVAQPAEARSKHSNDALKLILGAAAVGLLLNQMNKNSAQASTPLTGPWPNPKPLPVSLPTVPGECVMDLTVNGRLREVVSARCMREFGAAARLPEECAFDIRTSAGTRSVYGPQCLRENGYRIEAARY